MDEAALRQHLQARFPKENTACEWKEFKNLTHAVSGRKGEDIISYVSAIANMDGGHLVIGVEDNTLSIVGIQNRHDYTVDNIPLRLLGRCGYLDSEGLRVEELIAEDSGKVVWVFHIPRHRPRLPVTAHDKAWQRVGESLVEIRPERLSAILSESVESVDWSAALVPGATLDDLDPQAMALARVKFKEANRTKPFHDDIDGWDVRVFLDRAKLAVGGTLTRAALLLLGGPSAVHHLSPHPAQITWKLEGEERAYEHFGPPFLLTTTDVLNRIRNVRHKLFPAKELLATEVMKYDTRVILEALHNCIAHQDYTRHERIIVAERPDRLIFENGGSFFEGNADDYISGNKTPSRYRNPWLAQAMARVGMIDTMGYGIRTMAESQRNRFFPLPDYGNSTPVKVVLGIFGHVIDENYSLLLLERRDLSMDTVILLDRVQKGLDITAEAAARLRRDGLIEGRKPHYHVSAQIAASTGKQAAYSRSVGLSKDAQKHFILEHLAKFGEASRESLNNLLIPGLPTGLTDEQKRNKVMNLLTDMRAKDRSILCEGKGPAAKWRLASGGSLKPGNSK